MGDMLARFWVRRSRFRVPGARCLSRMLNLRRVSEAPAREPRLPSVFTMSIIAALEKHSSPSALFVVGICWRENLPARSPYPIGPMTTSREAPDLRAMQS